MNRIRELREEKGMTQLRLSIELGVTQETVSAYENEKHFPTVQILLKVNVYRSTLMSHKDAQHRSCL